MICYVGTYTNKGARGIYVYDLDTSSGVLSLVDIIEGIENPSFVTLDPQQRYLYAANELGHFEGQPSGAVSAFAIERGTGRLTLLNQQPSMGAGPCYVSVDHGGRYVLAANYMSGSVSILPIQSDGRLGEASDAVRHKGSSVDPRRQQGPHAHCILPDPSNQYALAADLGLDRVLIYRLDLEQGKLQPHDPPAVEIAAGAGPRHVTFHPNGRLAYLITEMQSTVIAFDYDAARGALTTQQTVPALPKGFAGRSHGADIHIAPSGRFIYGSNRGHDSIVIYAIDHETGRLAYVGHEPTQGRTPRNFAIDPGGKWLLVANQDSNNLVSFSLDQETGKLAPTGHVTEVPAPVCLQFASLD